jgi:hypothetical protein
MIAKRPTMLFSLDQGLGIPDLRSHMVGTPAIAFRVVIAIVRPVLAQIAADDRFNP